MPDINDIAAEVTKGAKETAYVLVGLGVLGFQKAQVRRRELVDLAKKQFPEVEAPLMDARGEVAKRVKELDAVIEEVVGRIETTLQPVEQRLPATAQALISQAKEVRTQLRGYVLSTLAA